MQLCRVKFDFHTENQRTTETIRSVRKMREKCDGETESEEKRDQTKCGIKEIKTPVHVAEGGMTFFLSSLNPDAICFF